VRFTRQDLAMLVIALLRSRSLRMIFRIKKDVDSGRCLCRGCPPTSHRVVWRFRDHRIRTSGLSTRTPRPVPVWTSVVN
jgi:hypothetical protein